MGGGGGRGAFGCVGREEGHLAGEEGRGASVWEHLLVGIGFGVCWWAASRRGSIGVRERRGALAGCGTGRKHEK